MRRNRLAAGALATIASLGLLASQASATVQAVQVQPAQLHELVIFAVQSRTANAGLDGNALAIANRSDTAVDVHNVEILVRDADGESTAFHTVDATELHAMGFVVIRDPDPPFQPFPVDGQAIQEDFDMVAFNTDAIPDEFVAILRQTNGAEIDRVATVDNDLTAEAEGDDPATPLDASTDQFNAALRRDVVGTDSNNNAHDFLRMPASWGTWL